LLSSQWIVFVLQKRQIFDIIILPSLRRVFAPAALLAKGGETMVYTRDQALERAIEVAKVVLASPACTAIHPDDESAKDVAEFIRVLADELSAM